MPLETVLINYSFLKPIGNFLPTTLENLLLLFPVIADDGIRNSLKKEIVLMDSDAKTNVDHQCHCGGDKYVRCLHVEEN